MRYDLSAGFCGLLFGVGLSIAGMIDPGKVLDFLDIAGITTGAWDPSLAFVMAGGIAVHSIGLRLARRRGSPVYAPVFQLPTRRDIDVRLVAGASLFGVGWGLGGICPGPALTDLAYADIRIVAFVVAMAGGMLLHRLLITPTPSAPVADPV